MVHIIDDPGFGPFSAIVPVDVPTGWECPRCKRVYSPRTGQCVPCSPPPQPFTGPLPRPKTGLFGFDLAPVLPVPVDEPDPEPRSLGYTFGGFPIEVTGHARRGPMCKCSLEPCPPSSEGGMCGCDEPDDGDPVRNALVIRLPGEMASPGYQWVIRVVREWAEIFPGLQAKLESLGGGPLTGSGATITFRLTPGGGHRHD